MGETTYFRGKPHHFGEEAAHPCGTRNHRQLRLSAGLPGGMAVLFRQMASPNIIRIHA